MPVSCLSIFRSWWSRAGLACLLWGFWLAPAWAQQSEVGTPAGDSDHAAYVVVDGEQLFPLRGITAFPASVRVAQARGRIVELARDESFAISQLTVSELEDRSVIMAGDQVLLNLLDQDAELEGIDRKLLATVYVQQIGNAIESYRQARSADVLLRNSGYAVLVTAVAAVLLWALLRLFRWLEGWSRRHVQRNIDQLASKSHELVRAQQVWALMIGLLRLLRLFVLVMLAYFYLNTVLGLYPWTRPLARVLFDLVLVPLQAMGRGFVDSIPNLAFLAVLVFVIRYLLKIIRAFFSGVDNGRIKLQNFDADWAMPTYKLVRLAIIAFSLVIAYPYIPGSDSLAFKGVTVFMGVILSLGSSSFIAGLVAGLTMTYRGAFKEGDLVRIGNTMGVVDDVRLMVTRLRTAKNEIVVIPNSNVLNVDVINYSTMARANELIVHTEVGIGYDTPWRQVEAMLLEAARRTAGLLTEPAPFVLQKLLGDFAVTYELNAYCGVDRQLFRLYSALHANIQDVFNEYGVQIMSPAYEADPAAAKVVPPEQWYASPAQKPDAAKDRAGPRRAHKRPRRLATSFIRLW